MQLAAAMSPAQPVDPTLERVPGQRSYACRRALPNAVVEAEVLHPTAVPTEKLVAAVPGEEHLDPVRPGRTGHGGWRSRLGSPRVVEAASQFSNSAATRLRQRIVRRVSQFAASSAAAATSSSGLPNETEYAVSSEVPLRAGRPGSLRSRCRPRA